MAHTFNAEGSFALDTVLEVISPNTLSVELMAGRIRTDICITKQILVKNSREVARGSTVDLHRNDTRAKGEEMIRTCTCFKANSSYNQHGELDVLGDIGSVTCFRSCQHESICERYTRTRSR